MFVVYVIVQNIENYIAVAFAGPKELYIANGGRGWSAVANFALTSESDF